MEKKEYVNPDYVNSKYVYDYMYRVDLSYDHLKLLQKYLDEIKDIDERDLIMFNEMKQIVNNPKEIKRSVDKMIAMDKAREAKTNRIKEKINNAINLLRLEQKKFTHYSVAKAANVAYMTVRKHISQEKLDELNKG